MPTYEYKCNACGEKFERFQSITAAPIKKCPRCGKTKVQRLIGTGAGLIFKGSGFYITDYRSEGYKEKAKAEASQSEAKPAATATDSKPGATDTKAPAATATADAKAAAKAEAPAPKPEPRTASKSAAKRTTKKR
jgi:putative FmdB family regulatory protein